MTQPQFGSSPTVLERQMPTQRADVVREQSLGRPGAGADPVGQLLTALYGYLRQNLPRHPKLGAAVAAMYHPVGAYIQRDVLGAERQAIAVYHLITQLRQTDPTLPLP